MQEKTDSALVSVSKRVNCLDSIELLLKNTGRTTVVCAVFRENPESDRNPHIAYVKVPYFTTLFFTFGPFFFTIIHRFLPSPSHRKTFLCAADILAFTLFSIVNRESADRE